MVINPQRKTNYAVRKLSVTSKFSAVQDVKDELSKVLGSPLSAVGYISPGHGFKGKHNGLATDQALLQMYREHQSKRCEIRLWCFCVVEDNAATSAPVETTRKRSCQTEQEQPPSAKRGTCKQRLEQVEDVVKKLREKHAEAYSIEKLTAWAHMINMGKHSSYDTPPNLPYFTGTSKAKPTSKQQDTVSQVEKSSTLSPAKRIQLRSECLDQLARLHSLLEKGGVPADQFDTLQKAILGDITKFQQ